MDIISHTLTGTAVGTVAASVSKGDWKTKTLIILIGSIGGALPDLDAISYWSKFDTTFGVLFNLQNSGRVIYSSKFWYSHHAALHSILSPLLILTLFSIGWMIKNKSVYLFKKQSSFPLFYLAFFFGYLGHLLEDMPTPASAWGGVNLFFPSTQYIGGFGNIWWWNNYDLVLIILSVIIINILLNLLPKKWMPHKFRWTSLVFSLGVMLFIYQIMTRPVNFAYTKSNATNYAKFEQQSKEVQRSILGNKIYSFMESMDNAIPLMF